MAAGFGTRMRPLTDNCPKPLIAVGAGKGYVYVRSEYPQAIATLTEAIAIEATLSFFGLLNVPMTWGILNNSSLVVFNAGIAESQVH